MDGADLGRGAGGFKQRHDAFDIGPGQCRDILAKINRQIGIPVGLIGGNTGTRDLGQNMCPQLIKPFAVRRPFLGCLGVMALHDMGRVVIAKIKGAVLAHDTVDRPHSGHMIAPARRPSVVRVSSMSLSRTLMPARTVVGIFRSGSINHHPLIFVLANIYSCWT